MTSGVPGMDFARIESEPMSTLSPIQRTLPQPKSPVTERREAPADPRERASRETSRPKAAAETAPKRPTVPLPVPARVMLAVDTPSSRASSRDDQWVTPSRFGGGSSVVTTIFTSSTDLGRPDLGRSSSALIPAATYRDRQWRTVGTDVPHRSATSVCGSPSAASSTILARRARPASPALEEAILASLSRSPVRSTSGAATRIPRLSQTERNFPSATLGSRQASRRCHTPHVLCWRAFRG